VGPKAGLRELLIHWAAANPVTSPLLLERMASEPMHPTLLESMAMNPYTPAHLLVAIARTIGAATYDPNGLDKATAPANRRRIRDVLAANPALPDEAQQYLAAMPRQSEPS